MTERTDRRSDLRADVLVVLPVVGLLAYLNRFLFGAHRPGLTAYFLPLLFLAVWTVVRFASWRLPAKRGTQQGPIVAAASRVFFVLLVMFLFLILSFGWAVQGLGDI